jgi:uncharacterized membrane protein
MNTILAKMTAISASIAAWLFVGTAQASGLGVQGGANAARGADQPIDLFGVGGTFSTITNVLLFIVGAIAVIMIVIGGLRYVTSGGNQNAVTAAKNTILYAIIGIIVAILAYAVINFVLGSLLPGNGGGTSV